MGIFGVLLAKLGIPNTPVVLGLILGSIIESNFVRTYTIVSAQGKSILLYVLTRPLCIGILLLTVYPVSYTHLHFCGAGIWDCQHGNQDAGGTKGPSRFSGGCPGRKFKAGI